MNPPDRESPPAVRATFRPHERLRHEAEFRRAFERRRSASDTILIVYAVENGLDYARLGLSVGRRKIRLAAGRNRFKRLVREAFRLNKAGLPTGVDLVVVPRAIRPNLPEVQGSLVRLARDAARRLGARRPQDPS
ncbi:MAG: ribonuclease P protein component [Isosphaeraceae bacterium]